MATFEFFFLFGLQNMSVFPFKKSFTREFFLVQNFAKKKNSAVNYEFHFFGNFNNTYSLVMKVFFKKIGVVARSYFDWPITKKKNWKIEQVQVFWFFQEDSHF
jgi:hypothetical protein